MAVMNPYNYSKPKNFIKSDVSIMTKEDPASKNNMTSRNDMVSKNDRSVQYLESRIMSAKPEELTFMLYEGLVKFIKKSIMYLEDSNFTEVNYNSQRAQAIIDELRSTLNMDVQMSESLDSLYEYMAYKLLIANVEKSKEEFESALEMAEDFKETWQQAFGIK